jgi:hypothetical protein
MPVRLAAKEVKRITQLAEMLGVNHSTVLRKLIDLGLESGWAILLLRKPSTKGRGAVGRVIGIAAAKVQATAAELAAERATGPDQVTAEIKALRAREHADALELAERDRLALAKAEKALTTAPTEPSAKDHAAATHRPRRHRQQRLTEAEIKAVADRAQARSENRD